MRIAIAASCCFGATLCAAPSDSPAPAAHVALIVDSKAAFEPRLQMALEREVDGIFRFTGYRFEWVQRNQLRPETSFPDLIVIRLRGDCKAEAANRPEPGSEKAQAIAWAHRSEAGILPFADVDCSRIRSMTRLASASESERGRTILFGRALGRVISHELYHILTGNQGHSVSGIARPALSSAHLTAASLDFTSREVGQLSQRSLAARQPARVESSPGEGAAISEGR